MPLLQIISNATIDDNKDLLAKKASQFTAELLGKPESYVMVHISTEQTLFFSGSNQPAALVNLKSFKNNNDNLTTSLHRYKNHILFAYKTNERHG